MSITAYREHDEPIPRAVLVDVVRDTATALDAILDAFGPHRREHPDTSPEWEALRIAEDATASAWAALARAHVALTGDAP